MSRFRDELRVVPRTAWGIAVFLYACLWLFLWAWVVPTDRQIRAWPWAGKVALAWGVPLTLFVLIALIGYVNGDAKRRGMRYIMWTLLAIFVPDAIGIILYFILRDPMPTVCPSCGVSAPARFAFCPHCGTSLQPTCSRCGKPVEGGWANCVYCGIELREKP